jgi:nitrate reductase gamma subunit
MTDTELLLWLRGPALEVALFVFIFGVLARIVEIFMAGKEIDLAKPRQSGVFQGLKTAFTRPFSTRNLVSGSRITYAIAIVFHAGLFITILLLEPHIQFFESILGFGWPGLRTPIVDAAAIVTIIGLLAALVHRITNPVTKFLSNFDDYLSWFITFLPMLTGYMAFHHIFFQYEFLLALHIMSVALFLIVFPFTKLMHAVTLFISGYFNGSGYARRGVEQ